MAAARSNLVQRRTGLMDQGRGFSSRFSKRGSALDTYAGRKYMLDSMQGRSDQGMDSHVKTCQPKKKKEREEQLESNQVMAAAT